MQIEFGSPGKWKTTETRRDPQSGHFGVPRTDYTTCLDRIRAAVARPCRSAPRLFEARPLRSIRRAVQALGRYVRAKASGMVLIAYDLLEAGRELTTRAPTGPQEGLELSRSSSGWPSSPGRRGGRRQDTPL
jgi:hypothetical protein